MKHSIIVITIGFVIVLTLGCGNFYNDILDQKKLVLLNATSDPKGQTETTNLPILPPTNGTIQSMVMSGDTIYFGGNFTRVGGYAYGAIIDPATGDIPSADMIHHGTPA